MDGILYFHDYIGDLYAVDPKTGTEIWHFDSGHDVYASPLVADGIVYAPHHRGKTHALDAKTGNSIWEFATGH